VLEKSGRGSASAASVWAGRENARVFLKENKDIRDKLETRCGKSSKSDAEHANAAAPARTATLLPRMRKAAMKAPGSRGRGRVKAVPRANRNCPITKTALLPHRQKGRVSFS